MQNASLHFTGIKFDNFFCLSMHKSQSVEIPLPYAFRFLSRISEKALTRQEILAMDKQRVERGNFSSEFFTNISKRFGAYFDLH